MCLVIPHSTQPVNYSHGHDLVKPILLAKFHVITSYFMFNLALQVLCFNESTIYECNYLGAYIEVSHSSRYILGNKTILISMDSHIH